MPKIICFLLVVWFCFIGCNTEVFGRDEPSTKQANTLQSPQTEASHSEEQTNSSDLVWMLISSALVLFMTSPGLAMFYSGLVRRKNVIGIMMQCLFLMGLMSLVWVMWGYSLAFGEGSIWIGNFDHVFLSGLTMVNGELPGGAVPDLVFMIFQGMFFVITPALICGAFAERMKFSAMVILMIAWGTLVYCPLCHWVWGEGFLFFGSEGALLGGALDFAGGTVVHVSSGISALVCAMVLGRRIGYGEKDMRPHNLTYTAIGAAMLWVGWFGFNAGSAVAANDLAANAFVVTHLSAAAGAVAWATIEWLTRGNPSIFGTASGAVAGLVGITPASGFVQPMPALLIGVFAGLTCFLACGKLKKLLKYDDALDVFGIHGMGGIAGALLTGLFASRHVNPQGANGFFYGGSFRLVGAQLAAVAVTILVSAVVTFVILKLIDVTIGLRVSESVEEKGLDIATHGEEGYVF